MTFKNIGYRIGNVLLGATEYTLYLGVLDQFGEQYADNILFFAGALVLGTFTSSDAVSRISFNQGVFGKNKIDEEKENSLVKKVSLEMV